MEYSDVMIDDEEPAHETSRSPDPSLLAEALIKTDKLRIYIAQQDASLPATQAIVRDFNGLRIFVVEAWPRLAAMLPPELPVPQELTPGSNPAYGEIFCFCDQIKDFLKRRQSSNLAPRVDDGRSLFGPGGLKHDPALLNAARAKAQSILDFITLQVIKGWGGWRTPASILEDYNQLLALIREAAPESASVLPREITIPADPKPVPEDQSGPSNGSWFSSFFKRDGRPKTPRYRELLYLCQQIARLLK